MFTEEDCHKLLDKLRGQLGFMIFAPAETALIRFPPRTPEAFTNTVFRSIGVLTPSTHRSDLYKQVLRLVTEMYEKQD